MPKYERVIVSFTSYPLRIDNCSFVVDSLLKSEIPLSIELNLSLLEFPKGVLSLPALLQDRVANGSLSVNWLPTNTGVFKKIIPVLKKHYGESYVLLSIDDDRLYGPLYAKYMVEKLKDCDVYCCDRGIVGNRVAYRSSIFTPVFWENLSNDMVATGIDDIYIRRYLKYCNANCKFFVDADIQKQIRVFHAVFGHTYPQDLQKRATLLADRCFFKNFNKTY